MKKSLLALAVLGAFAGVAQAQTNVTIYGVADVSIERSKSGGVSTTALTSGNQSGSRIGFKGSEDLGGGLKAQFQLENGYDISNGGNTAGVLFNRQAWVGLSGGFGSVKFGRQYTPLFTAIDTVDAFGTGITGGGSGLIAGGYYHATNGTGIRANNAIDYSISFGGVALEAQYSLGEVAGSNSENRQIGLGATYGNGPLTVVAAYHQAEDATTFSGALGDTTKEFFLGATYDLGAVKLHGTFGQQNGTDTADNGTAKRRLFSAGVTVPVSAAGAFVAQYTIANDRTSADDDGKYWGIGYTHSLSKRTNLYTSYSRSKFDSQSDADSWLNVGIRHLF